MTDKVKSLKDHPRYRNSKEETEIKETKRQVLLDELLGILEVNSTKTSDEIKELLGSQDTSKEDLWEFWWEVYDDLPLNPIFVLLNWHSLWVQLSNPDLTDLEASRKVDQELCELESRMSKILEEFGLSPIPKNCLKKRLKS